MPGYSLNQNQLDDLGAWTDRFGRICARWDPYPGYSGSSSCPGCWGDRVQVLGDWWCGRCGFETEQDNDRAQRPARTGSAPRRATKQASVV